METALFEIWIRIIRSCDDNRFTTSEYIYVIFWVVDICDMNVVGEKCVWLQNKERIDTHNNTVKML